MGLENLEIRCIVCGATHINYSGFCDSECELVYEANKEAIDEARKKGIYLF